MKNVFISFMLIITSIFGDFFAFRSFEHPDTKKIVYMLYDIHASLEQVSDEELLLTDKRNQLIDAARHAGLDYERYLDRIDEEIIKPLRANLPNLQKQHKDLIDIVKEYHISLIDEDWPNIPHARNILVPSIESLMIAIFVRKPVFINFAITEVTVKA